MSTQRQPTDQSARDRISSTGLGATLFVEAGAGTGKTTQLVDRIVNTVVNNEVALSDIAAITFTEAAAAELQARIRVSFERRIADENTPNVERATCEQAVADSDSAAISTVHGFASRLLNEFSVAAGLPPRVTVLDEVSSQLAHERRWDRFVDRLHGRPEHEELLYRAALMDIALSPTYSGQPSFKDVAANFGQNWDRLGGLADAVDAELGRIDFAPFDAAVADLRDILGECTDVDDALHVNIVGNCLPGMVQVVDIADPHAKLRALSKKLRVATGREIWKKGRGGKKGSWQRDVKEVKSMISDVNMAATAVVDAASITVVDRLMRLTAGEVLDAAKARRADGGLEFHDLLVLARGMLREKPEVRRALHERYRHVLLDEFQDTDPIQIEVASLIAATPADTQPPRWQDHPVPDGRLFFVGDPKQSIYRFRRADIKLYLEARDAFGDTGGPVSLNTNFRTVRPIIDWVNGVFADAMPTEIPGAQPEYQPLEAWRDASDRDHRPIVFGGVNADPKVKAGVLRDAEAADVAAIVDDIVRNPEHWPVDDRNGGWRSARLEDVTILIPTRTSLPYLRDALDASALPYRLATGTLVYDTQEVRDLLAVLRAIDDQRDTLSLVAALRSPLYGCSDADLLTYHRARPRWDLASPAPDSLPPDHPVVAGMAHLRSLWEQRWWLSPATLLDRVLRERRAFLLAYGDPRPVEVWRRLRFLLDQARSFEESNGGDLRAFLDWAALQNADGARVHEPLLPETDEDALQILTVHGSKGLEFPITILSGMTTQAGGHRQGVSVLWGESGPPEVKLRSGVATSEHQPRADLEAEMGEHEKLRLLYVAATRARDHLVVSGHHKADPKNLGVTYATRLAAFAADHPDLVGDLDVASLPGRAAASSGSDAVEPQHQANPSAAAPDADRAFREREEWVRARRDLLAVVERPTTRSATAIAATADAEIVDVDDDSRRGDSPGADSAASPIVRRQGRAGSSIGRAVHATLEFVDFEDQHQLSALVERQCDLESILDHAGTVEALVRSALGSAAVELARTNTVYRELYVGAPLGDVMVEGYVDLLIRTPEGLVIVDYKTDTASTPAEVDAKVAAYELQAATYAVALETTTGLSVVDARFVFCQSEAAIERAVVDLDAAKQRVRDAVGTEREA